MFQPARHSCAGTSVSESVGFGLDERYAPLDGDRIILAKPVREVGQFFPREGIKSTSWSWNHGRLCLRVVQIESLVADLQGRGVWIVIKPTTLRAGIAARTVTARPLHEELPNHRVSDCVVGAGNDRGGGLAVLFRRGLRQQLGKHVAGVTVLDARQLGDGFEN